MCWPGDAAVIQGRSPFDGVPAAVRSSCNKRVMVMDNRKQATRAGEVGRRLRGLRMRAPPISEPGR